MIIVAQVSGMTIYQNASDERLFLRLEDVARVLDREPATALLSALLTVEAARYPASGETVVTTEERDALLEVARFVRTFAAMGWLDAPADAREHWRRLVEVLEGLAARYADRPRQETGA